jgi:RES domain
VSRPAPPLPPLDIDRRVPVFHTLARGTMVHRFFTKPHESVYFDSSDGSRFNAPDGAFGVLYAGQTIDGAFAETFLRAPGRTVLPADLVARKGYARLKVTRAIRLVRLAGPGLARMGATAEVCHRGQPYEVPQAWAKALHGHPVRPDGIAYTARHDDAALCLALFDRSSDALIEDAREADLDADWFWLIAGRYGVGTSPPWK